MAQKNITFDIGGKIKEASGSYYDDATNTLVLKNVSADNISLPNLPDGIAFVSGTTVSSSGGAVSGKVVTWDATAGRWGFTTPSYINVNTTNPAIPASSDVSGQFNSTAPGILVRNLSNVNSGISLPVSRGGTGLSNSQIPPGEHLLIGNGSSALTFLTASNDTTKQALVSNGSGWELSNGPATVNSSVEIQIFTSSATWNRPTGTKAIRVLAQGGGGGGGSGANRNSDVAALGGSGGASGGFIDTGIFLVQEDSIPVVVGKGGPGGYIRSSGSAGLAGGGGYGSHFGNFINNQQYIQTYFSEKGFGGTLVTTTTINGGGAAEYGLITFLNPDRPVYNTSLITSNRAAGASATATTGSNIAWASSSYYGVPGGAGGGALTAAGITYDGGNGGTSINNKGTVASPNATSAISSSVLSLIESNISSNSHTNNIFVSSGGGGGASSATTIGGVGSNGAWGSGGGGGGASTSGSTPSSTYDFETISLRHFDLSEATPTGVFSPWGELSPDRSLYGNYFYNGTQNIISTASAGIPAINSLFSDGVLSSSAGSRLSSGWDGTWVIANTSITDNFTVECWVYLLNAGSSPEAAAKSYLIYGQYNSTAGQGLILGVNSSNQLMCWSSDGTSIQSTGNITLTMTYNTWNHIALQKQGTTNTFYLNGTSSVFTDVNTTNNSQFGIGLGNSIYTDYNPNGYFKEFMVTSRVKSEAEIQKYVSDVRAGLSGSYPNPVGVKQGGDGGNGYVAVISYKY